MHVVAAEVGAHVLREGARVHHGRRDAHRPVPIVIHVRQVVGPLLQHVGLQVRRVGDLLILRRGGTTLSASSRARGVAQPGVCGRGQKGWHSQPNQTVPRLVPKWGFLSSEDTNPKFWKPGRGTKTGGPMCEGVLGHFCPILGTGLKLPETKSSTGGPLFECLPLIIFLAAEALTKIWGSHQRGQGVPVCSCCWDKDIEQMTNWAHQHGVPGALTVTNRDPTKTQNCLTGLRTAVSEFPSSALHATLSRIQYGPLPEPVNFLWKVFHFSLGIFLSGCL